MDKNVILFCMNMFLYIVKTRWLRITDLISQRKKRKSAHFFSETEHYLNLKLEKGIMLTHNNCKDQWPKNIPASSPSTIPCIPNAGKRICQPELVNSDYGSPGSNFRCTNRGKLRLSETVSARVAQPEDRFSCFCTACAKSCEGPVGWMCYCCWAVHG